MGRKTKVVDHDEAVRLLKAGLTYPGMIDYYKGKYGIDTTRMLWTRFYHRYVDPNGRTQEYFDLLPWTAPGEAKGARLRQGLRALGRVASGVVVSESVQMLARQLRNRLMADDLVVDYDNESVSFITVPRRPGIDQGWIRDPFIDDEGRWSGGDERVKLGALKRYVETGGMCFVDPDRPLAEGESLREPLDLSFVRLS